MEDAKRMEDVRGQMAKGGENGRCKRSDGRGRCPYGIKQREKRMEDVRGQMAKG